MGKDKCGDFTVKGDGWCDIDKLGGGLSTMELPDPLTNPPSLCHKMLLLHFKSHSGEKSNKYNQCSSLTNISLSEMLLRICCNWDLPHSGPAAFEESVLSYYIV